MHHRLERPVAGVEFKDLLNISKDLEQEILCCGQYLPYQHTLMQRPDQYL
jgi:hypothetical protein